MRAAPELPPVLADAQRVEQVLANLLVTPCATRPAYDNRLRRLAGQWSAIPASPGARRAGAVVADNGPGIPPDELVNVFERFYRRPGAQPRQTAAAVSGWLRRSLVAAHGGRTGAFNRPEGGAAVCLPLAP